MISFAHCLLRKPLRQGHSGRWPCGKFKNHFCGMRIFLNDQYATKDATEYRRLNFKPRLMHVHAVIKLHHCIKPVSWLFQVASSLIWNWCNLILANLLNLNLLCKCWINLYQVCEKNKFVRKDVVLWLPPLYPSWKVWVQVLVGPPLKILK